MSWQSRRPEPTEEEVRRRRIVALSAVGAAFLLFVLAIAVALIGSGGDSGVGTTASTPARTTPKRPPPRPALPVEDPVPSNAPGAHKAPNESVPVLVYNVINTPQPSTSNPQDWVPPQEFNAQMAYLAAQKFNPVTMSQVRAAWKQGGLLPSKPIVITFDTGYHSVYANAFPTLKQRGWRAVLCLQTSQTQADFPTDEVKALVQGKWELCSQGNDGTDLTGASDQEVLTQVGGSRQALQRSYGVRVQFFSYPQGVGDQRVAQFVQSAGYVGAMTLQSGLASPQDPPYQLKRIQVQNGDGEQGLASKLQSAGVGQ